MDLDEQLLKAWDLSLTDDLLTEDMETELLPALTQAGYARWWLGVDAWSFTRMGIKRVEQLERTRKGQPQVDSPHRCSGMDHALNDERLAINYWPKYREYVLMETGLSGQVIDYCPWCGAKLPSSLRDALFDRLKVLGVDWTRDGFPDQYDSDEWSRNAGL